MDGHGAFGRRELEGGAVEAVKLDLARRDVERRTAEVPDGASVLAEMADVGGRVEERPAALVAVLRVGCMLQRRPRVAMVVEPEGAHGSGVGQGDVAEQRVVGVRYERGLRQARQRRSPPLGDVLELAVAVELVAEEVAEEDGPRPDAAGRLGQRRLVDLEEAELGAR